MPVASNSGVDTGMLTDESSWECDATEPPTEDATACDDDPQFFLRIVESALTQGDPSATVNGSCGMATTDMQPSSNLPPASGIQYANAEHVPFAETVSSSCDPDGCNWEDYIDCMSPVTCVDPAGNSPVPSLCYQAEEGASPALSAAPSPSDTYYAPLSPVPSLYYSESSPEVESPVQSRAVLQYGPVAASPTLPSIEEESILSRTYRAVGATLVSASSSRFPSSALATSSSARKATTTTRQRKTLSSTSRQARHPTSPRPRNLQSPLNPQDFVLTYTNGAFRCPVPGCRYVPPSSQRKMDVRRHFETHRSMMNKERWVCCGVPVERAAEYGIEDVSGAYEWRGYRMVGGCQDGFSRRDSLKRHLERASNNCVGHMDMAEYLMQLREGCLMEAAERV